MTNTTTHTKSPFLAGLLGLIPGFGHLYAGHIGKSLLLLLCLFLSIMVCFPINQVFRMQSVYQPYNNSWVNASQQNHYFVEQSFNFFSMPNLLLIAMLVAGATYLICRMNRTVSSVILFLIYGIIFAVLFQSLFGNAVYYYKHVLSDLYGTGWNLNADIHIPNNNIMVLIWLCFFGPLMVLYSVADAVVMVLQHNRQIMFGNSQSIHPQTQHMQWGSPEQELLRQGARERGMPV